MSTYLLAHDVGTTGDKAILFDDAGGLIASAFAPYATRYPRPGWAEQSPADWWEAVCRTTRAVLEQRPEARGNVAAVGISAMMNGCVLVGSDGKPVRTALIHADVRGATQCERISAQVGFRRIYEATGHRPAPHYTLGKLAWLAEHAPDSLRAARWCLQAKDYLSGRLTGVFGVTDPSDASLTGVYDIHCGAWIPELAEAGGFDVRLLPEIVPSTTVVGTVTPEAADATGLPVGTPVVLGGGDGACATAGAGSFVPGDAYHYLGGTSWIAVVADSWQPDPMARITAFRGLTPGQFVRYGTVQSAGSGLEWFLDAIGTGASAGERYQALEALAAQSPPGARGLFFLPYLQGERAPIWDGKARGAFIGLTAAHSRADMARSVYEGVAFALGSILDVFDALGPRAASIRALGGGMRSTLWRSIFAAVYDRPLEVLRWLSEATACGAAIAAGVGIGLLPDWQSGLRFAPVAATEIPDEMLANCYRPSAAIYATLYPALADRFAAIAAMDPDQ